MIEVCITDDHPMVLDGISYMLKDHKRIHVRHCYNNGNMLLAGLQHFVPDVLLLDIQMPDYSGEELIPIIKEKYPDLKILAITSVDNITRVRKLIRLGCLGYLLKNTGSQILSEAIEKVYTGTPYIFAPLKEQIRQDALRLKKEMPSVPLSLTHREQQILQLIAQGYSSPEIATQLTISLNTVEKHRSHLFQKMDVKNIAGLLRKALQLGLAE